MRFTDTLAAATRRNDSLLCVGLDPDLVPVSVVAVGRHDASEAVPADVRERDSAPRHRRALQEMALTFDI